MNCFRSVKARDVMATAVEDDDEAEADDDARTAGTGAVVATGAGEGGGGKVEVEVAGGPDDVAGVAAPPSPSRLRRLASMA